MLYPSDTGEVTERAYRAMGTLRFARSMSRGEMMRLLSDVRLSLSLGIGEKEALLSPADLNFLCIEGLDLCLATSQKQKCSSRDELERIRAEFLSKYISGRSA